LKFNLLTVEAAVATGVDLDRAAIPAAIAFVILVVLFVAGKKKKK